MKRRSPEQAIVSGHPVVGARGAACAVMADLPTDGTVRAAMSPALSRAA
ncbi:hypothetical protein ACRAWG_30025 [Methylobacterium sp. P31]